MLGQKDCRQPELFVSGSLRDLVPADPVLVRVDKVLDLGWLEAAVADLYSAQTAAPGLRRRLRFECRLLRSIASKYVASSVTPVGNQNLETKIWKPTVPR
ncbi:hypothetical protein SAMN05880556_106123 [Azospirillum sp. RU38E]|nr:hypothetical protein SAMN05880556_106123 [Azospirillum sp. RU38E]SNS69097.1 hypothetical protein SAMN05880591_10613 [Azospirillum sp. RU37A]